MSLELCVLASGSGGNATALRSPGGLVLIDAGVGPRTAAQRLAGSGVAAADVAAVCLTHLDRDHFSPGWFATLARREIPVYCHASRAEDARAMGRERGVELVIEPFTDDAPFEPLPGLSFTALPFAHDSTGSHGFVVGGRAGGRVGYATDLGRVPDELVERFCGLDVLAIESNYDPKMQMESPRPFFLKQRIMGGRGHLSNQQAFDAIKRVFSRCEAARAGLPAHVVLLHRSRQCNCPRLIREVFARDVRISARLVLAEQHERTEWLRAAREAPFTGEQLALAFG